MKVLWLSPYPVEKLKNEIRLRRDIKSHPCTWIVNLSGALSLDKDVELHLLTYTPSIEKNISFKKDNIYFHVIRNAFPYTYHGFPVYLPLDALTNYNYFSRQLREIIGRIQPDIIHVHGTEYGFATAAVKSKVPTIISIQGIINLIRNYERNIYLEIQSKIERSVIRKAAYFGSRTKWANEFIMKLNPSAKIFEMQEAINYNFFNIEKSFSKPSRIILFIGSIEKRKGIEDAIWALFHVIKSFPKAKLLIIGDGEKTYIKKLKNLVDKLNLQKNIEWKGFQDTQAISKFHDLAELLIHPSHIDNSPNSVAEALVSGLPVIASNVGGIPSMIKHQFNGILINPQNPMELAERISSLFNDINLKYKLSANSRLIARKQHLPQNVANQTKKIYYEVINASKKNNHII